MTTINNKNVRNSISTIVLASCLLAFSSACAQQSEAEQEWIQLFNGENLEGWTVKINHHEAGENFGNTFRVEEGILKVRYDAYGDYNDQFGHLYYDEPFSYYHLSLEYRFVGEMEQRTVGDGN